MDTAANDGWLEDADYDRALKKLADYSSARVPHPLIPKPQMTHAEAEGFERHLLHAASFELTEGDTLIFVDFPNPPPGVKYADCTGIVWSSQKLRISSQKLLETGSSKFAEMLGPTYQYRIIRRRKLVNQLPDGVKYVLDLTPPTEGDELVFQMTELSITTGLTQWWAAFQKHKVDDWVCRGHDDVCICWKSRKPEHSAIPPPASEKSISGDDPSLLDATDKFLLDLGIRNSLTTKSTDKPVPESVSRNPGQKNGLASELLLNKEKGDLEGLKVPEYRKIRDYCPIRHRVNILRLIMIIAGKRMLMDSAPRVWTLVGITKIFDCTNVIRDQVLQWFMTANNTAFIEVLPEEALKIGFTLQFPDITRSAFCILVNEMALEAAADTPDTRSASSSLTIFGRRRQDPGDDLSNLIQHAARAMVERISSMVSKLSSDTLFDQLRVPQWERLSNVRDLLLSDAGEPHYDRALGSLVTLTSALRSHWSSEVVGHAFNKLLLPDVLDGIDDDRAVYVEPRDFIRFESTYKSFNRVQKALCPFFYQELASIWQRKPFYPNLTPAMFAKYDFNKMAQQLRSNVRILFFNDPDLLNNSRWAEIMNHGDIFSPLLFYTQLGSYFSNVYSTWLRHDIEPPLNLTRHMLLNLEHNELKYLPLWAGGNNDGTGGVFEEALPPADFGPAGPGPAYHTGVTIPSDASSTAGSMSSDLRALALEGGSMTGPGSIDVQDGISTIYNRNRVVADDVSVRSEAFTEDGADYSDARYEMPEDNQSVAEAMNLMILDEERGAFANDDEDAVTEIGAEDTVSGTQTPSVISMDDSDDDDMVIV